MSAIDTENDPANTFLLKKATGSSKEKLIEENLYLKRRWFSILLSWITIFVSLLQFSMFSSILGPFLLILEPGISKEFSTWAVVAFSLGQMVTPPLFGLWNNKIKQCRLPICVGLLIQMASSVAFCCLEAFPLGTRKWTMLVIRVIAGLGAGVVSVPRNYCATASTKTERPKAVSGSTAALGLSVIAGPGVQAMFSFVGYPGYYLHTFHLHMYNSPAFASIIIFSILLILNATLLLERYPGLDNTKNQPDKAFNSRPLPKYDKIGAWASVWCWFCIWATLTNFVILGVPFTQAQFDWSLSEAISYNGCIFGAFAATSLLTYTFYAFFGSKLNDRVAIITGSFLIFAFYMITFPWPGYPVPQMLNLNDGDVWRNRFLDILNEIWQRFLETFNNTDNFTMYESLACEFASQPWCLTMPRIPVALYLVGFTLMAVGFPIANSALSILLAKILGPRRQGTMQGVYITAGGLARSLGPLVISLIFNRFGPQLSWTASLILISSGLLCAVLFRKRLVPLNVNPILKPGDHYYYKYGVVCRF